MYKWGREIGSTIIFHLSKWWKYKFFILCAVIFLVRLQGKFETDHSWEWKGSAFAHVCACCSTRLQTLHGKRASLYLQHGAGAEVVAEHLGVDGGGHEHDPEVGVGVHHAPQHHQQEVRLWKATHCDGQSCPKSFRGGWLAGWLVDDWFVGRLMGGWFFCLVSWFVWLLAWCLLGWFVSLVGLFVWLLDVWLMIGCLVSWLVD